MSYESGQPYSLQRSTRPAYEDGHGEVTTVDLFAGCGGMALGIAQAARSAGRAHRIPFAIDMDESAVEVFRENFPGSGCLVGDAGDWFAPEFEHGSIPEEQKAKALVGHDLDFLVGGPPCQGNSNLNNHTRRRDPRNALYSRMARAARILEPEYVIIENVPNVLNDRGGIVAVTAEALEKQGYKVYELVLDLSHMGLPQTRKRHVLLGTANEAFSPASVLCNLARKPSHGPRTVRWAIGDLEDIEPETGFDRASTPSADNARRIQYLFDNDEYDLPNHLRPPCHRDGKHSYKAVYGRLRWDSPAPTITTGFNSMGQGRYVHPFRQRTITPHEAARLQYIPDFFDFSAVEARGTWARLIGNAVPPLLTTRIAKAALDSSIPRETGAEIRATPEQSVTVDA